jgi:hypothetical protein
MTHQRPIRIANASGFFGDRHSALREIATGGPVDVITGDYLAEVTMTVLAKLRAKDPSAGYAPTFLTQLAPVVDAVVERGIKIVVNAGGLNPAGLADKVRALGSRHPKVAWLSGDDLAPRLAALRGGGARFANLETGAELPADPAFVITANAYLGAWGIVRALAMGADIVICPRVTDASLVVGAAAWWHGWRRDDWDALAGAVAAGHIIECGPQATGGNYSGFRSIADLGHPGFPIAEVAADGSSVITKHPGHGGAVTVGTVTAQLVYEIASARYLNPDVTTHLESIQLAQQATDRVALTAIVGSPPPPTTKVAITTHGAYRNEMIFAMVGLEIDAKIALIEQTTRAALAGVPMTLAFQRIGTAAPDAAAQNDATTLLRIVATSADERVVGRAFSSALIEQGLSSYPGLFALGLPGAASEAIGYWPALIDQRALEVRVTHADGATESIDLPPMMAVPAPAAPAPAVVSATGGATRRVPLGAIADARSGDKGSDANVGLWVRTDEAFAWLRGELTIARLRELLPEASGLAIDRHELANLRALNFVIHGLLQGGAIASIRLDHQAKALGEFLRSRWVDAPLVLLEP